MRWVVFCFAALFAASVSLPAAAQTESDKVTIKVTVLDPDGKPVPEVTVLVAPWPTFSDITFPRTGEDGSVSVATYGVGAPLSSDTYVFSANVGDDLYTSTIIHVPAGRKSVVLTLAPGAGPDLFSDYREKAAKAAQDGDSAGYEQNVKYAQNSIKSFEKKFDDAQQAADDFARDNGLQVKDLRGVTKDIDRVSKLPEDLQDKERLEKLNRYREKLEGIQRYRSELERNKKELAELKPPEKKFGLAPSACPEGQSGGLLAGGINSLFGTDLAGVCDDKQPQRRDTDRQKGGDRRERDEHD